MRACRIFPSPCPSPLPLSIPLPLKFDPCASKAKLASLVPAALVLQLGARVLGGSSFSFSSSSTALSHSSSLPSPPPPKTSSSSSPSPLPFPSPALWSRMARALQLVVWVWGAPPLLAPPPPSPARAAVRWRDGVTVPWQPLRQRAATKDATHREVSARGGNVNSHLGRGSLLVWCVPWWTGHLGTSWTLVHTSSSAPYFAGEPTRRWPQGRGHVPRA